MRDYHKETDQLRALAQRLEDQNPLKLCVLTLACVAECQSAAQAFERQALAAATEPERQFNLGAAQAVRVAGERLILSIAGSLRAICTDRNEQNKALLQMIDLLTHRPNVN